MIDIIMATYNGELYLKEQIDSILDQSYKDIRLIIRDDGSKDGTLEIVREYTKKYPDKILLVTDDVVCGSACKNFMQAMKSTSADYIMFADQDDYWLVDKVQHTLDHMIETENRIGKDKPVLVFGSYEPVDASLKPIHDDIGGRQVAAYKLRFSNLLVQNYVNGCLMMVNRALASAMGEYDDAILMHDWWAALIASGGGAIEHIEEDMMLYRQHGTNVVGSVNVNSWSYRLKKIRDPKTKNASQLYLKQAILLKERAWTVLNSDSQRQLDRFIDLYNKGKVGRIVSLIKGRYLKSDLVRILGQFWYI